MRVLVSGGAGYIGSHTVVALVEAGHDIVVVDDFSNAKPTVIGRLEALTGRHVPVHAFDLTDADKTAHLFEIEEIDAVIHFAGYKAVGESVQKPLDYYENNVSFGGNNYSYIIRPNPNLKSEQSTFSELGLRLSTSHGDAELTFLIQQAKHRPPGGDFYNTMGARVDPHFASAVISAALEGQTLMGDAFDLLSIKNSKTFREEARHLGVTS